jgi:hypothetical protein
LRLCVPISTEDIAELRAQRPLAWRERAVEGRRTDGEGVDSGLGQCPNALRRADAAGNDQLARKLVASGADQVERLRVDRAVGQQVDPRAAQSLGPAAVLRDVGGTACQTGRMALGTARERIVGDAAALKNPQRGLDLGSSQEPVDADLDCRPGRIQTGL